MRLRTKSSLAKASRVKTKDVQAVFARLWLLLLHGRLKLLEILPRATTFRNSVRDLSGLRGRTSSVETINSIDYVR